MNLGKSMADQGLLRIIRVWTVLRAMKVRMMWRAMNTEEEDIHLGETFR